MSTTTSPCRRRGSTRCSTAPGRTSTQRSARGSPVTTESRASSPRWTRREALARARRDGEPRPAASSPDTSSRIAELLGHASRRSGSASTRTRARPRRASSAARPAATVLRPGAPAGPHTATTRPVGPASAGADGRSAGRAAVAAAVRRRAPWAPRSRRARRAPSEGRGRRRRPARRCRSGWPAPGRRRSPRPAHDRHRPHAVRAQVVDRGRVETGRLERRAPPRRPARTRPWRAGRRRRRSA